MHVVLTMHTSHSGSEITVEFVKQLMSMLADT